MEETVNDKTGELKLEYKEKGEVEYEFKGKGELEKEFEETRKVDTEYDETEYEEETKYEVTREEEAEYTGKDNGETREYEETEKLETKIGISFEINETVYFKHASSLILWLMSNQNSTWSSTTMNQNLRRHTGQYFMCTKDIIWLGFLGPV